MLGHQDDLSAISHESWHRRRMADLKFVNGNELTMERLQYSEPLKIISKVLTFLKPQYTLTPPIERDSHPFHPGPRTHMAYL